MADALSHLSRSDLKNAIALFHSRNNSFPLLALIASSERVTARPAFGLAPEILILNQSDYSLGLLSPELFPAGASTCPMETFTEPSRAS